jgi:SAM-dependent methyltransferase
VSDPSFDQIGAVQPPPAAPDRSAASSNGDRLRLQRPAMSAGIAHTVAFVRRHLPRRACRVLEVGCGEGELAAALQNRRCSVVAIDEDATAVSRSRRRGVDARRAQWPRFDDGLFDVILFARSLSECDDIRAGVAHAVKQLRPGGRLLIEDRDFAAADPVTVVWLHGVASGLVAAGVLPARHWLVDCLLGTCAPTDTAGWQRHDDRGHEAVRQLLAETGLPLQEEATEYLFRYVETTAPGVQERVRRAEAALIAAGAIEPVGRRFVVG